MHQYLYEIIPNSWTGRACHISWAPCSLHLTLFDYFLSEYLKDNVDGELPEQISDLTSQTTQAGANIGKDTLEKFYKCVENRLCFELKGGRAFLNIIWTEQNYFYCK